MIRPELIFDVCDVFDDELRTEISGANISPIKPPSTTPEISTEQPDMWIGAKSEYARPIRPPFPLISPSTWQFSIITES